jgi:hypothetical protein
MSSATYNWKLYWYMIFNLVWLQARQTGSSIKTKVLLGVMLIDTTVHQEILVKQALKVDVFTGGAVARHCYGNPRLFLSIRLQPVSIRDSGRLSGHKH